MLHRQKKRGWCDHEAAVERMQKGEPPEAEGAKEGFTPQPLEGVLALQTLRFRTSVIQNYGRINLRCFKQLHL